MNKIEEIYSKTKSPVEFARQYLDYVSDILKRMDPAPIAQFIGILEDARIKNKQIIFLGNGGSAATASHFANDVSSGPRSWDKPYRALALTDNVALITALANDHGYDKIFELQLKILMQPGDVVIGISASGNSPNVLSAIKYANEKSGITIGLTGFDGGELAKMAKLNIHVPTAKGEYGPVEDIHMVVDHLVGAYLSQLNKSLAQTKK